jgi:hypothetical protein
MNDERDKHRDQEPIDPAGLVEEERSVSGTIGTLALGAGLGKAIELGVEDLYGKVKDVIHPTPEETPPSPIVMPPGVTADDDE